MSEFGPQTAVAEAIHAEKYRGKGESFKEACNRIASSLVDHNEQFRDFRQILMNMRFMPGGRVQAAVGSTKRVTPYNCYVSGTIDDSMVSGNGSIMARLTEAATTMRMGGGIGYDFSTLRPSGDRIRQLDSKSSGPLSFMKIFNEMGLCIASAGHRRGAQMGVMRIDHPDIEDFIRLKQTKGVLEGFNVSIGVTDEFMDCLADRRPFTLQFEGRPYREVDPWALWEMVMRSTWDWAEPGVLFIDRINHMNNLGYCETIAATNPCGEQPLPPYGACLLGSFNLTKYVKVDLDTSIDEVDPTEQWLFDFKQFKTDIRLVVRAMDNVVDRAIYPLREQEREAKGKRRMGLGVTGLANALEVMGMPYGSEPFLQMTASIMETLRNHAYDTSADLAVEKGAFPMFDQRYLDSPFIQQLPEPIRNKIAANGVRNSHLISIAPTGTISLTADNVSSGIEPVFAYKTRRTIIGPDGPEQHEIEDYAVRRWGVEGKTCDEVGAQEHLAVLSACYPYVDSAVSKTCNVPPDMPWEDFKQLYIDAYEAGCKGLTTFQVGGKRGGMMSAAEPELRSEAACRIDLESGRRECE